MINQRKIVRNLGIISFKSFPTYEDELIIRDVIFQSVTPIRSVIENSYYFPVDKMICYSELFREIRENEIIPEYEVTLHYEDGRLQVESIVEIDPRKPLS